MRLDEDFLGHVGIGGGIAQAGAEDDFTVGGNVGSFDDGIVKIAVEAITHLLSHFREVTVVVVSVVSVDTFAQVGDVLIGSATIYSIGTRESTVNVVGSRSTGEEADFEFSASFVFSFSLMRDSFGDSFRSTGSGKTGKTDSVAIFDDGGSFFGSHEIKGHIFSVMVGLIFSFS